MGCLTNFDLSTIKNEVQRLWGGGDFGSTIAAEVSRWSAP